LLDVVAINVAFILSIYARIKILGPVEYYPLFNISLISSFVIVALLFSFNQYRYKRNLFDVDEFIAIGKSFILTLAIISLYLFLIQSSAQISRFIVLLSFIVGFLMVIVSRYLLREFIGILRKKGYNTKKTIIISDTSTKELIIKKIKDNPQLGYKITNSLNNADVAFVSSNDHKQLFKLMSSYPNIEFKIIPDVIQTIIEPAKIDEFVDIPLITIKKSSSKESYLIIKRIFDIIFSLLFLVVTLSLIILIGIINLCSYRAILFTQVRIGKNLTQFKIYKFRTMKLGNKPKNEVGYLFKSKKDPRVTKFGRILRRTCLDELPQLFNILLGDMSFVGPRPCLKKELHLFKGWKGKRFRVKPGLTGLWQISGRHELNLDKAALLDLYYVNHMSLALDLKVILKTIPAIIFSRGIW